MRVPMIRFRYGKRPFNTPLEKLMNVGKGQQPQQVNQTSTVRPPSKSQFVWSIERKPLSQEEMDMIELGGAV
eukprot:gene5440-9253_t